MNSARRLTFPWHGTTPRCLSSKQNSPFTMDWTEQTIGPVLIRFLLETRLRRELPRQLRPNANAGQWHDPRCMSHRISLAKFLKHLGKQITLFFRGRSGWVGSASIHLLHGLYRGVMSVSEADLETSSVDKCRGRLRLFYLPSWQTFTGVSELLETARKLFCFPQVLKRPTFATRA